MKKIFCLILSLGIPWTTSVFGLGTATSTPFQVTAAVASTCTVTVLGDIDFGTYNETAAVSSTTDFGVDCTTGTIYQPYIVATTPPVGTLSLGGTNIPPFINYDLFRPAPGIGPNYLPSITCDYINFFPVTPDSSFSGIGDNTTQISSICAQTIPGAVGLSPGIYSQELTLNVEFSP